MSHTVRWLITDQNVTVNYDGETHIVKRSDALANRLIKAVKEGKMDEIPVLVSAAKRIETFSKGNFVVKNGRVLVNGFEAPPVLSDRIMRFSDEGLPFQPLVKFAEKLQQNPSFRAVNELYQFLEKNNHPLTETGNFIAYKKVRENFTDVHTGKFDNSVGKVLEMPRNQVNEDANQTCSYGLHVANWDYAHNFYSGGPMLEVEVDPSDVVAVPTDYNQAKMRVCKYKVLGVVTQPHDDSVSLRTIDPDYEEENDGFGVEEEGELCLGCDALCEPGYKYCFFCEEEEEDYPYDDELEDEE